MKRKLYFFIVLVIPMLLINCASGSDYRLQKLIGLEISSNSIQEYLNELDSNPVISKYDDVYYYIYDSKGIDFSFNNDDTLKAIFLYSESSEGHRQFQETLPYNILFSDSRKDIEKKLGSPDINGGDGVINYYSIWEDLGIRITYKKNDQEDMNNKINNIALLPKVKND